MCSTGLCIWNDERHNWATLPCSIIINGLVIYGQLSDVLDNGEGLGHAGARANVLSCLTWT